LHRWSIFGFSELFSKSIWHFSLILVSELQKEILAHEDAYFIIEVEKGVLENTVYNSFFSQGIIDQDIIQKMPFVDWNKFKLKVKEKSSQAAVDILTIEKNTSRNTTTSSPNTAKSNDQKAELICKICGKKLSDKKNLKKHIDVVHFNIRRHHCNVCIDKRFITRSDLQIHIEGVHNQQKFICDQCGQALSTRQGLRQHSLIHVEDSKSIQCQRCEKKFRHLSTYRKHISRVHDFHPDRRLPCQYCGKLYNHKEGLIRHVKKYHSLAFGSTPEHSCKDCGKSFVYRYDLNKHTKSFHNKSNVLKKTDDSTSTLAGTVD